MKQANINANDKRVSLVNSVAMVAKNLQQRENEALFADENIGG